MIRHLMEVGLDHVQPQEARERAPGWVLLSIFGLCLEFWIVVVAVVALYL